MIWKYARSGIRLAGFIWVLASAAVVYCFTVWLPGKSAQLGARAQWMSATSRRLLRVLNIQVLRRGTPPTSGLLAANHLGYVDIVVLGSAQPTIFLAKSEVRGMPVLGLLTACAGTLFIRRDKRTDVARFDEPFARVVNEGLMLGIFPEGTSTDGHRVLPFHSSLFKNAASEQWPVTPAWIGYEVKNGSVENEVCYWGDMIFFPHFLRLIQLDQITATVVYGEPIKGQTDRKEIARQCHRQVCQFLEARRPGSVAPVVMPVPAARPARTVTGAAGSAAMAPHS